MSAAVFAAGIVGTAILNGGAGRAGSGGLLSSGRTVEDAKRVVQDGLYQRDGAAETIALVRGSGLAVGSLTDIDIDDAQTTDGGLGVNGIAHYDIATSAMNVPDMIFVDLRGRAAAV